MSKNVAVFVDVANIFYAAKAAGVDIDYVTLLKSASAGRDLVRAYAYTGLDPDNENQRNFHSFLARHGYRVVSKDIRKYGDGKVKANLDIELVVDMMKTARNLDIAIVVSGDGDFAPAIRAVQEMGVRVEVISFRGNTSSDLMDVADQFTDITALAKVEKGSSRSGRRVAEAGDEDDLSMTEVPDKQTEGTGDRRGRGGRGRGGRGGRPIETEPAARSARGGGRAAVPAAVTSGGTPLVVLPGEKLSKVPADLVAELEDDEADTDAGGAIEVFDGGAEQEAAGEEGPRRRRRRGGRGRGRGRGREGAEGAEGLEGDIPAVAVRERTPEAARDAGRDLEEPVFEAPRAPRTTPFGSVWDSQLGVPSQAATARPPLEPLGDDEDFDEPEIPEYLLAERRNRGRGPGGPGAGQRGGRGGGPRGGRSAYAAAIDRERYGRGGGGGGINRYPDVSARERPPRDRDRDRDRGRDERPRPVAAGGGGGAGRGGEEWSEVPPELEAMLRAQLSGGSPRRPGEDRRPPRQPEPARDAAPGGRDLPLDEEIETFRDEPAAQAEAPAQAAASPSPARRGRRPAAAAEPAVAAEAAGEPGSADASGATAAPKRRTTRRTAATASPETGVVEAAGAVEEGTPKRRTSRRSAATGTAEAAPATESEVAAPKRRTTRRTAGTADAGEGGEAAAAPDAAPEAAPASATPKRRTTRRTATADDSAQDA